MKRSYLFIPLLLIAGYFTACKNDSNTPPVFTLNPVAITMQEGRESVFHAKVTGRPVPLITWERSTDGITWSVIEDTAGERYSFTARAGDDNVSFRARAVNIAGEAISQTVKFKLATAGYVTQVTRYGVTWTFDREYSTGEFVTGDYWVVGPVTVVSVYPEPTVAGGIHHNGSMINPDNGTQAYDSGTEYFGHRYRSEYRVEYPVTINNNSSLVSAISVMPTGDDPHPRPSLKGASVLTVLPEPAPDGTFRPGLIGNEKKLYNKNNIHWELLPDLKKTSNVPDAATVQEKYTSRLKRPWLLHGTGWLHRHIMPEDNSPSYHRDVAMLLDEAAVLTCISDWGDRTELVINYIQVAIDYYTMQLNGKSTGVQGAYNYRWPIIFAGIMLGDNDMRDMWVNHEESAPSYHQTSIYYWEDQVRTRHSDIIPAGDTWTGYHAKTGKRAVFYDILAREQPNVGGHEELHPTEWFTLITEVDYPGGGRKQEGYRQMHSASIPGFALAAFAFNARGYFDFPEYFDYADRWMTETVDVITENGSGPQTPYTVQTSYSKFVDEMWFKYRSTY